MSSRTVAARYARALFDVARKEGDPARAGADLDAFVSLASSHADLLRALVSPAVPVTAKANIVSQVLALQPVVRPVERLLAILAEHDRLALLPEVATLFRERLLDYQQVVKADVITAVPLPDEKAEAVRRSLAQATGKQVLLQTHVDPTILGGVVARVGSLVFDGSVARHLARVKERLIAAAQ